MKILILFSLLVIAPVFAGEHEDIVNRAFETVSRDYKDSWAYRETSLREDLLYVATYDPRRPVGGQWVLESVDEREPTSDELEWFIEKKAKTAENEREEEASEEPVFQPGTLELIEETSEHWLYSFVPAEDDDHKEFMQHIDGTVKVIKDGHYVEYFDLSSETAFKPMTGVKIKSFRTRMGFAPVTAEGPVVPTSVDFHIKGRAFLAVKINETEKIRYTGHEYVGTE